MNYRNLFAFSALSLALGLLACAAPTNDDGSDSADSNEALSGPKTKTSVVATCGSPVILNGFIDPRQVLSAEISETLPAILNGFPVIEYSVTIKKGDAVQAKLDHCTGGLARWNLHCTSSSSGAAPKGEFDLSDETKHTGVYQLVGVTSPAAEHQFSCNLAND
jgi:hypothetical protein